MFYSVVEIAADIIECLIIFVFLIKTLSFNERPKWQNYLFSVIAYLMWLGTIITLNYYYVVEGLWGYLCIFYLVIFSRLSLKQKHWVQIIISIIPYYGIMMINPIMLYLNTYFMGMTASEVIMMRNWQRVLLITMTKIMLSLFLYFVGRMLKKQNFLMSIKQGVLIIILMLLSFGCNIIFMDNEQNREPGSKDQLIVILCFLTINIMFLILMYFIISQNNEKLNNEILKFKLDSTKRNVEETAEWNRKIEKLRHDIKNHMSCLRELINNNEKDRALSYIQNIYDESINTVPNHIVTDHPTLNAILNLKESICRDNNIDLRCCIPQTIPNVDDMDMCVILSNLFDNAIEAEMKEENPEIKLDIVTVGNYLRIKMKNRISAPVLIKGELPETSKSDKDSHGYGILSIIDAVNRNDGMHEFYEENNYFAANVLLKIDKSC